MEGTEMPAIDLHMKEIHNVVKLRLALANLLEEFRATDPDGTKAAERARQVLLETAPPTAKQP